MGGWVGWVGRFVSGFRGGWSGQLGIRIIVCVSHTRSHDGHPQVLWPNKCLKMGKFIHQKDDCRPSNVVEVSPLRTENGAP